VIEKLNIRENKIINSNGKEIKLKGINLNSPCILKYEEKHNFLEDIKQIKKLGANSIRVPICPAYFQSKPEYCDEILDPIVSLCKKLNLYCLLDWHAQGNPLNGETRMADTKIEGFMKYDARFSSAKKAAEILAKRYGKEPNVMFEPFCAYFLGINSKQWNGVSTTLVNIIRKYSDSIIAIGPIGWPQSLESVFNYPIKDKNVAYSTMIYFNTKEKDKKVINKLREKYVILVVECGYEPLKPKEKALQGTKQNYAYPLKKFLTDNELSWFAWCYHPIRQPVILNSWNPKDLSEWGKFVKKELLTF